MGKTYAALVEIAHNGPVRGSAASRFLRALKSGLLLALREKALLTDQQLQLALEQLEDAP